jgi:hypothetical protein
LEASGGALTVDPRYIAQNIVDKTPKNETLEKIRGFFRR